MDARKSRQPGKHKSGEPQVGDRRSKERVHSVWNWAVNLGLKPDTGGSPRQWGSWRQCVLAQPREPLSCGLRLGKEAIPGKDKSSKLFYRVLVFILAQVHPSKGILGQYSVRCLHRPQWGLFCTAACQGSRDRGPELCSDFLAALPHRCLVRHWIHCRSSTGHQRGWTVASLTIALSDGKPYRGSTLLIGWPKFPSSASTLLTFWSLPAFLASFLPSLPLQP